MRRWGGKRKVGRCHSLQVSLVSGTEGLRSGGPSRHSISPRLPLGVTMAPLRSFSARWSHPHGCTHSSYHSRI